MSRIWGHDIKAIIEGRVGDNDVIEVNGKQHMMQWLCLIIDLGDNFDTLAMKATNLQTLNLRQ